MTETLGAWIKRLREEKRLAIGEAASRCLIPATMLQSLERDERRPSPAEIKKLSALLSVKESEILARIGIGASEVKTELKNTLSSKIIETREKRGFSQSKLAELAKITSAAMSQIESGQRIPSTPVIKNIASVLNVSIDFLLGNADAENADTVSYDKELQAAFRQIGEMSQKDREKILEYIEFMSSKSSK